MFRPRILLPILISMAALAGCNILGGRDAPVNYYLLSDQGGSSGRAGTTLHGVLLLRETEAAGLCQGGQMVYSRAPGSLEFYQHARWNEPPARALGQLLKTRLDRLSLFQATAGLGSGVVGDWQLNTRLLECHHDAGEAPGSARLTLEVELVRRDTARLVGRHFFSVAVPAASHDATGAAQAFSLATGRLLDQLTAWLVTQAGPPAR